MLYDLYHRLANFIHDVRYNAGDFFQSGFRFAGGLLRFCATGVIGLAVFANSLTAIIYNGSDMMSDAGRLVTAFGRSAEPGELRGAALRHYVPDGHVPGFLRELYRPWANEMTQGIESIAVQAIFGRAARADDKVTDDRAANLVCATDSSVAARFNDAVPTNGQGAAYRHLSGAGARAQAEAMIESGDAPDLSQELGAADFVKALWLAENTMSSEATDYYRRFVRAYQAPQEYRAWEEATMASVRDGLAGDSWLRQNLLQWKRPGDYQDRGEATAQHELRRQAAQHIADTMRAAFGLPPIPVYVDALPGRLPVAGAYIHDRCSENERLRDGFILLNYHDNWGTLDHYRGFLDTMAEEAKHSVDNDLARAFIDGTLPPSHIAREHAAVIALNGREYLSPHSTMLFGMTIWQSGVDAYQDQYIEDNAKSYKQDFADAIIRAVRDDGTDAGAAPSATPHEDSPVPRNG